MIQSNDNKLISLKQLQEWEAEYDRIIEKINEYESRCKDLKELIRIGEKHVYGREKKPKTKTLTKALHAILLQKKRGMTYDEIKTELAKTSFAEHLQNNEKSVYRAVEGLKNRGLIIKYNRLLFDSQIFREFEEKLHLGLVEDINKKAVTRSVLGLAIKELLDKSNTGYSGIEIKREMLKRPEFKESIERNHSHSYNALSALVKKGEIIKKDKLYFSAQKNQDIDVEI